MHETLYFYNLLPTMLFCVQIPVTVKTKFLRSLACWMNENVPGLFSLRKCCTSPVWTNNNKGLISGYVLSYKCELERQFSMRCSNGFVISLNLTFFKSNI